MADDPFGGTGAGTTRFDSYHNRVGDGSGGALRYPSPFFDIGHTYLPTSITQMFKWCRYYFLVNPLVNAVTYKMAEYPITPIEVKIADQELREYWTDIIEHKLKLRTFGIEVGLDYFAYGNAFVTIHFPFNKYLICAECKKAVRIEKAAYKFRNLNYYLACEHCGSTTEALVMDHNVKDLKNIRLIRWNPEYIKIEYNEITGETNYFLDMPTPLKNDILMGKKHIVEKLPKVFIEALRKNLHLAFAPGVVYHLKRPTIAQKDMGWGMPLILPVLKDTYYLQILRKAQEAIAQQHIVPLRILFPQSNGGAEASPYSLIDLGMWRKRIESEIQKWRMDPNYLPILPLPIGNEVVGGEGRALMLHQEMRAWSEQIIAGMHVPAEFVYGGLQYSGSNVSMRMLENQFLSYRTELLVLMRDFILGRIASYMGYAKPNIEFKRFKMADDLQRLSLLLQANQAMKVSDTTWLEEADLDIIQEEKYKQSELNSQLENQRRMQMASASIQGDVMKVQTRYQLEAQKMQMAAGVPPQQPGAQGGQGGGDGAMQPQQGAAAAPGMPESATAYPENAQQAPTEGIPAEMQSPMTMGQSQGGFNILYLARRAATELGKMQDAEKYTQLMQMKGENPQLYSLVLQLLSSEQGSQADPLSAQQMPLPQVKPPRRENSLI